MRLFSIFCLSSLLTFSAAAQESFRWFKAPIDMGEGGRVEALMLETMGHRFVLVPPRNAQERVETEARRVQFTWTGGQGWVQITTNSPGGLPKESTLKEQVLQQYPGARLVQSAVCYTGSGPGWMIDSERQLPSGLRVRSRHVFLPFDGGTVEFLFSVVGNDLGEQRFVIGNLLNSFRINALVVN